MPAANYNFTIEKGTAFVISFEYKDNDNNIIDLSNWVARLRWKDNTNVIKTFITNTRTSDYEFIITPTDGKITLKIPAAQTAAYAFTSATYDLELQEPNDLYSGGGKKVFRILAGTITVLSRNVSDTDAFTGVFDVQDNCGTCT
tara:strand:- start:13161 stop:13592 length:432 start_codon:yes stop_codon:yes gene_type:complete